MAEVGMIPQVQDREDRIEFGHLFRWSSLLQAWTTTSGRLVLVEPPNQFSTLWFIRVPSTKTNQPLTGDNIEERAFSIAEAFSRQKD
jgi:hypothetical protein